METIDKNQNKKEIIGILEQMLDIAKKADDVAFFWAIESR